MLPYIATMKPYFGLRGGWLTFWVSVACSTDMTLFGALNQLAEFKRDSMLTCGARV